MEEGGRLGATEEAGELDLAAGGVEEVLAADHQVDAWHVPAVQSRPASEVVDETASW